jgi:hypothetical protein
MDNLLQPYLRSTNKSDAENRLKEFYSSVIEFIPHGGIFVQFSRLNYIEGPETHWVRVRHAGSTYACE